MKKNKKLLLASVAAMGVLALGVGATSTFAWYTASTAANPTTTNTSLATVTTAPQENTVDGLTFDFTVKANGGTSDVDLLLGDAYGNPATKAIYKLWNPGKTALISYDVADDDVGDYYTEVTVALAKISVGETDYTDFTASATKTALSAYKGTFTFSLNCNAQGKFSDVSTINTSAKLGALYNSSSQAKSFTVVIGTDGALSGTYSTVAQLIVIQGQDAAEFNDAHEGTTLSTSFTSVVYA